MTTPENGPLAKVRKLLAKAEAEGTTPAEAKALTAKAAELMAKYGIDRALADVKRPERDKPTHKRIRIDNPFGRVKALLLQRLAKPMRCESIRFTGTKGGEVVEVFGYESDLERLDIMYTSILLQMFSASRQLDIPSYYDAPRTRAYRRSWMLGYITAVADRVQAAENKAEDEAVKDPGTPGTALVLADRSVQVNGLYRQQHPRITHSRITYNGGGYGQGRAAGQRANIGGTGISHNRKALN